MKNRILIVCTLIVSLLIGIWITIGYRFIGITKSYYIKSEMLLPYEDNSIISCNSYAILSPFGSDAYDYNTGEVILDSNEIFNYEKRYNIYLFYYDIVEQNFVVKILYSYKYQYRNHLTEAEGEMDVIWKYNERWYIDHVNKNP